MFLDKLEKNELEYIQECKEIAKESFVNFYGEKYRKTITKKIDNLPIIFIDRNSVMENSIIYENLKNERENLINQIENINKQEFDKNIKILNNYLEKYRCYSNLTVKDYFKDYFNTKLKELSPNQYLKKNIWIIKLLKQHPKIKNFLKLFIPFFVQSSNNGECIYLFKHDLSVCCFPNILTLSTETFIHELNHSLTHHKFNLNYKMGIECIEEDEKCSFTYINETITEYFTQKICKDSINLFFKPTDKTIASYSYGFVLIQPFLEKYIDIIKDCYISLEPNKFEKTFNKSLVYSMENILSEFIFTSGVLTTNYHVELETDFNTALKNAKYNLQNNLVMGYSKKYYNSFILMEEVLNKIDNFVKNSSESNTEFLQNI